MEPSHRKTEEAPAEVVEVDDRKLLEAVARVRDQEAFARLYDRYERPAYRLALHLTGNRELAREALQEAMLSVWKFAARFKDGEPRAWIFRIIANRSLNIARGERGARRRESSRGQGLPQNSPADPEQTVLVQETDSALGRQLSRLPPRDRQLLALRFCCGLNQTQIARLLDLPARTVSSTTTPQCH